MDTLRWRRQLFRVTMVFLPYAGGKMSTYMPAFIWVLSNITCLIIAKRRGLKNTAFRATSVVMLGPLAIPFVLAAKPQKLARI